LNALTVAAEKVRGYLRYFSAQEQSLLGLKDEVASVRNHQAPEALRRSQEKHKSSGLEADEWTSFLLGYTGDVDSTLAEHLATTRLRSKEWKGTPLTSVPDSKVTLLADDAELERTPLALLEAEITRLQTLVSVDRDTAIKFAGLSKRINDENAACDRLKEKLTDCEGAIDRVKTLVHEREVARERFLGRRQCHDAIIIPLTDIPFPINMEA
jgi:hypothetical protein